MSTHEFTLLYKTPTNEIVLIRDLPQEVLGHCKDFTGNVIEVHDQALQCFAHAIAGSRGPISRVFDLTLPH